MVVLLAAGIEMAGVVPPEDTTGAVPVTAVTVPDPVPAPIAVRNVAASKAETVLSALIRMNLIALGLGRVKRFEPSVVAPSAVRAAAAVVDPVPPLAIATVPDTLVADVAVAAFPPIDKLVAVPVKPVPAPVNDVAVKTPVLGTNENLVDDVVAGLLPVEFTDIMG